MPDFDRIKEIKTKNKLEHEKKLRCFSFAKLYFLNKDYQSALRNANEYLTVKEQSAPCHKLLGEIYEALDDYEKAFDYFNKSYILDKSQEEVLLKICKTLEHLDKDPETIKKWLKKIEEIYPYHSVVVNLREKLSILNVSYKSQTSFRDISSPKISDLTDDKITNVNKSFLSIQNTSTNSNQIKNLERSVDQLNRRLGDMEEKISTTFNKVIDLIDGNKKMFSSIKGEIETISSSINHLTIGQQEIKSLINDFINHEDDDEENDEENDDICADSSRDSDEDTEENKNYLFSKKEKLNFNSNFSRLGPVSTKPVDLQNNQVTNQFLMNNSEKNKNQFLRQEDLWKCKCCFAFNQKNANVCVSCGTNKYFEINQTSPLEKLSSTIEKTVTEISKINLDKTNKDIPLSELFKDQNKNIWECTTCLVKNNLSNNKCVSCETPKQSLLSVIENEKPKEEPKFSFGIPSSNQKILPGNFVFDVQSQKNSFTKNEPFNSTFTFGNSNTNLINNTSNPTSGFVFGPQSSILPNAALPPQASLLPNASLSPQASLLPNATLPPQVSILSNATLPSQTSILPNTTLPPQTSLLPNATLPSQTTLNKQKILQEPFSITNNSAKNLFSPPKTTQNIFNLKQNDIFTSPKQQTINIDNDALDSKFSFNSQKNFTFTFDSNAIKNNLSASKNTAKLAIEENEHDDHLDEEPHIDFVPVIPLPPIVDVVTGEENEKVVFTSRAKLYRFVSNEWKERGLGEIKILHNTENNKYRFLMRRDQIFKVCLNHPITSEFSFQKNEKPTSNTLIWTATDYSEGEAQPSLFTIKFKTNDILKKFEKQISNIVDSLSKTENPTKQTFTIFDDLEVVYFKQPKSSQLAEKAINLKLPINFFSYEDVKPCKGCNGCDDFIPKLNYELEKSEKKEVITTDTSSNSLNLFSVLAQKENTTAWPVSTDKPSWLSSSKPAPIFSGVNETNLNDPESEANLQFKPVIPLPDLIDITTGEEEEEVLFSIKSKLFKFVKNEWKERGVGDFKILKHKKTEKIRFLMRRNQVHKVCLNHIVDSNFKIILRPSTENVLQWFATDFSEEGEGEPCLFNLRVKNNEAVTSFLDVLRKSIPDLKC